MGEPGTKEVVRLEDLEAAGNIHTGRKHVLSVLVENKAGVLTRIAGLFARRGFNIDTLAVGPTEDESVSRMTIVLDDRSGRIEVSLFDDVWQQHRAVVQRDAILVVEGQLRYDEFIDDWRINAKKLTPIGELREREARRVRIRLPAGGGDRLLAKLEDVLRAGRGGRCAVEVHVIGDEARGTLRLADEWSIRPTRAVVDELARLVGRDAIRFGYGQRPD